MAERPSAHRLQATCTPLGVVLTALALILTVAAVWFASTSFLVIFAGVLVAVALDAGATFLVSHVGGPRRMHFGFVVVVVTAVLAAAVVWGGATVVQQFGEFVEVIDEQMSNLMHALSEIGISFTGGSDGLDLRRMLPNLRAIAGEATNAIFASFGIAGSMLIVLFLGVFFAAEPGIYKVGMLSLAPHSRRERIAEVVDRTASALRSWMLGQAISMLAVFVLAYALLALIGIPYALMLALTAGVLEFIPTLGPTIAGVIIVLGGFAHGTEMALWALGAYIIMQVVESNLLQPLIQERVVRLPAAFNLSFQIVMGALFGVLGVALAVPIAAAGKVLVNELYVRDVLGGPADEAKL
jgi:predicted PurR-regulated permease PerM